MEQAQSSHRRAALAVALACGAFAALPAQGSAAGAAPLMRVVVTGASTGAVEVGRAVRAAGGRVLDQLSLVGGVSAELPRGAVLPRGLLVVADRRLSVSGLDGASDGPANTLRATLGIDRLGGQVGGGTGGGNGGGGNGNGNGGGGNGNGNDNGSNNGGKDRGNGQGAGVTVAVVDTGVADVADLAGRVTHIDVTGTASGGHRDGYGHGTFVAGLIAGNGASSDGAYTGVAPRAHILDVRVADSLGGTDLISVLKGLQAVAAHPNVDVVNLSLSSDSPLPYQIDPLTVALETLWRHGVTVIVPAGNDGPAAGSIASPGLDPVLITAGALDDAASAGRADDTVPSWSSVGPAPQGVSKPDLVAPGSHLVSLRAPGSTVDVTHPLSRVGRGYFRGSGTSFSTAVTSGAVATLLGSGRGDLRPDQVKDLLTGTAYRASGLSNPASAGAGGLDLGAAQSTAWADVAHRADSTLEAIPGDPEVWQAFVTALMNGDEAAAASSWSQLSAEARNWAASSWSQLSPEARNWAASSWSVDSWVGPDGSAADWLARNWAARNWAARNWSARNWAASSWSASSWSARNWAASSWSASSWSASSWSASSWSASSWSASSWSARNWSSRNWAASSWSTTDWG